jgi:hypothetical protein
VVQALALLVQEQILLVVGADEQHAAAWPDAQAAEAAQSGLEHHRDLASVTRSAATQQTGRTRVTYENQESSCKCNDWMDAVVAADAVLRRIMPLPLLLQLLRVPAWPSNQLLSSNCLMPQPNCAAPAAFPAPPAGATAVAAAAS